MNKNDIKKRRHRRKIFISILLIILCAIVFTFSTYAWFTANKSVTVDSIDVKVTTANGLQISADAIEWKTGLDKDDLNGASSSYPSALNQLPADDSGSIAPVSTVGQTSSGLMNMFGGNVEANDSGDNVLTTSQSIEKNSSTEGEFVAFDVFIKMTQANTLYLMKDSKLTIKEGSSSKGIENATRVAFINEGTVDTLAQPSQAQALRNAQTPVIWEPNNNAHTDAAIANARDSYGKTITSSSVVPSYYGVKTAIPSSANIPVSSNSGTYFGNVTPTITSGTGGLASSQSLGNFNPGITKIRIYLWVEGQDYDCEDNASGGELTLALTFSIDNTNG